MRGKKVLLVEDGPTLTHGGMSYGAGKVAADKYGAAEIVDPRPFFAGSLQLVYRKYPHIGALVPAMGYFPEQVLDLEATINAVPCDTVVLATPMDLRKVVHVEKPAAVVVYGIEDRGEAPYLSDEIDRFVENVVAARSNK